jgi:hypothetical protein
MLEGNSANILEDKDGLMALRRPPEEDHLTNILCRYFPVFFSARKPGINGRIGYISEQKIQIFVGAVTVLLAAAFLFGGYLQSVLRTRSTKGTRPYNWVYGRLRIVYWSHKKCTTGGDIWRVCSIRCRPCCICQWEFRQQY